MVTVMVVRRKDPDGTKDDNNRSEKSEKRVSDLNSAVFTFCHVHEHEKLKTGLDKCESENDPEFC